MRTVTYSFGGCSASFMVDDNSPLNDLEDLRICHLGMHFLSVSHFPEFSLYEFHFTLRPLDGSDPVDVHCCGIVVQCEATGTKFRTTIHFCDFEGDSSHLEDMTRHYNMRCDYCNNC